VWTTCLVFFQTALLLGYAYADWTVRNLSPRSTIRLHVVLLVASVVVLPIVPGAFWKPAGTENPSWLILGMLTATIGLPYFLLSTTSPLVQVWFSRRFPGRSPYRLFALSNVASMLALVGYPFLLEPWVVTRAQAWGWSIGYVAFVALCAAAGFASLRAPAAPANGEAQPENAPATAAADDPPPSAARQGLWIALAATGSVLLLAVSNHVTQNVAAVPLLWIVPLSLYLLTFILSFSAAVLLIWIWYHTGYTITDSAILITYGPVKMTVPINEIESIRGVKSPFTAPALSMDRIEIQYARFKLVAISPKDKAEFVRQLLKQNQTIKLRDIEM
jgi:hypothetical protein